MSAITMNPLPLSILVPLLVSLFALASSALIVFVRSNASQEEGLKVRAASNPEEGVNALTRKGGDYHGS